MIDKYRIVINDASFYIQERGFLWVWKPIDERDRYGWCIDALNRIKERTGGKQKSAVIIFKD